MKKSPTNSEPSTHGTKRTLRPPPEIELKSLGVSVPHILALRYHTMDGKTHIMEGDKILHMMAMMRERPKKKKSR